MAISWGTASGNGRIGINVIPTVSNTSVSVSLDIYVWTKYSCSDTSNTLTVNGSSKGSVTISTSNNSGTGWSTSNQQFVKTVSVGSYGRGTSARTVDYSASISGVEYINATPSVSTSYTIPALASYTVSYNANGGSGAPSSRTKYYGVDITLSTTKPTRSGYTFQGWSTANDSTVEYAAGATYTGNAALTLYAVWKENALTVNYYSNYATSAFDGALNEVGADKNVLVLSQPFYYDNDYSLYGLSNYSNSTGAVYMTRTGYTATGNWGTSASGGTLVNENTTFATGQLLAKALGKDLLNSNASVNVYAQWKPNIYTVTYDGNGGLYNGATTWSENVTYKTDYTTWENFLKERVISLLVGMKRQMELVLIGLDI